MTMKASLTAIFSVLVSLPLSVSLALATEQAELLAKDVESPVIVIDKSDTKVDADSATITAAVADNVGIAKVTIFYRGQTNTSYDTKLMQLSNKAPNLYTVELPLDGFESGTLEYYIRAEDVSGNSVFEGLKFAPLKLDIANECNESIVAAGIKKSPVGVYDDFNSNLQTGRNRDGVTIGFFTFQDSDSSIVTINSTSEHIPLADEANGNAVLQLNLDVKAWGGVIHAFENPAVNRWTPRDWRGFTGFSFWLYGNNNDTPLFVEILDNRKPCPYPAGAEVFNYSFTDNFSGWKQITVPFNKLVRKETYNGAPDDGLGLSEVHGWAFGTLNTGGPVTYYIDDFELR